jgi:hypothetical protein
VGGGFGVALAQASFEGGGAEAAMAVPGLRARFGGVPKGVLPGRAGALGRPVAASGPVAFERPSGAGQPACGGRPCAVMPLGPGARFAKGVSFVGRGLKLRV